MWEDVVNEENTTSPYSIVKQIREEKFYEAVSNALMKECKHSAPGARLSARLRNTLERYLLNVLTQLPALLIDQSLLRILFTTIENNP